MSAAVRISPAPLLPRSPAAAVPHAPSPQHPTAGLETGLQTGPDAGTVCRWIVPLPWSKAIAPLSTRGAATPAPEPDGPVEIRLVLNARGQTATFVLINPATGAASQLAPASPVRVEPAPGHDTTPNAPTLVHYDAGDSLRLTLRHGTERVDVLYVRSSLLDALPIPGGRLRRL
jgi:hypothetical protein